MAEPLQSLTDLDEVSNVCLFICDSLREDYLPTWIRERGVAARSIASASYTAASVPSLVTGEYPSTHGCWHFHSTLPERPLLFERPHSYDAHTVWTQLPSAEKPPIKITNAESGTPLEDLEDGFVYVEHDKGGHSPYGYSFDEHTTPTFYESLDDSAEIPDLYQRSIDAAAGRFREMMETLESRGILDETLVVFTSDHGELLGEPEYGGLFSHDRPVVPEVVRVPLVFMGAGLPEGVEYDALTAGVDVAPTLVSALTGSGLQRAAGVDLWRSVPRDRTPRTEHWRSKVVRGHEQDYYHVVSGWSEDGGVVRHLGARWSRVAAALYTHLYEHPSAPHVRDELSVGRFRNLVDTYLPTVKEYGDASEIDVGSLSEVSFAKTPRITKREYSREQLRDLGYVE